MNNPWELLAEADACLLNYLARTGSLDDGLLKALVLLRETSRSMNVAVAVAEVAEHQPTTH